MTNTVNNQPAAVSPQLTDVLLAWQAAQSPSTRKMTLAQVISYALALTGGTVTGPTTFSDTLTISSAAAASTQALRADQAWQKVASYTVAAAASQVVLLPVAFQRFRLTLQKIIVGTGATQLNCQFSADGGSTFSTSNQAYGSALANTTINSYNSSGSTIALSASLSTSSITDGTFEIWPGAASLGASIRGTSTGIDNNGFFFWAIANGSNGANVLMNALKVQISGGVYSGKLIVEGLP